MPEVLISCQLGVDALGLEHDADLAAEGRRILDGIAAHDQGATRGRNHQCRKNAEKGRFAAAVGAEKSKEFCGTDVEGDTVERCAVLVTMDQILYRNDGLGGLAVHNHSFS